MHQIIRLHKISIAQRLYIKQPCVSVIMEFILLFMFEIEYGREIFPIELFINIRKTNKQKKPKQNNHMHSEIASGVFTNNKIAGIKSLS